MITLTKHTIIPSPPLDGSRLFIWQNIPILSRLEVDREINYKIGDIIWDQLLGIRGWVLVVRKII